MELRGCLELFVLLEWRGVLLVERGRYGCGI